MLLVKRDLRGEFGRSLSQRFAHHLGRYLTTSSDDQGKHVAPFEIAACYALLGHNPDNMAYDEERLKRTIRHVIGDYHDKTGYWLNQEQVAFAVIWQGAKQQAATLHQRFKHLNIPDSTLSYGHTTSTLHLALIADALKITKIRTSDSLSTPVRPSACSRTLNLLLDEASMTEIESIGREVRKNCEKTHTQHGVDIENLQTRWHLRLRYEGCKNSLTLKCMPIEMLRETFENLYLKKYGVTDENRLIIIEELEIEVGLSDAIPEIAQKTSIYTEQWMSQWQTADGNQTGMWVQKKNPAMHKQFNWLYNLTLEEIVTKLIPKQADSPLLGFFLAIQQKDVDEVTTRN